MLYGSMANESSAYRNARDRLLEAEIALRDQRERVAALRRELPLETAAPDCILHASPAGGNGGGPAVGARLADLFLHPEQPLIVYQFMYGGAQKQPCPMCCLWIDGFNGIGRHLNQRLNFAIVAEAEIGQLREWAQHRGWSALRMLSSAGSSFKRDMGFADAEGNQFPGLSVFVREGRGVVKHFYSACALVREKEARGIDLYTPFWNLLDLLPEGRGEWMPKLEYGPMKARSR